MTREERVIRMLENYGYHDYKYVAPLEGPSGILVSSYYAPFDKPFYYKILIPWDADVDAARCILKNEEEAKQRSIVAHCMKVDAGDNEKTIRIIKKWMKFAKENQ